MKAEIICVGTELLLGEIIDTNAAYLAQVLAGLGIDLYYKTTVGDNLGRLTEVLKRAWDRSDLLILSGGLGPTQDDLTREGIAGLIGEEIKLNEEAWSQVKTTFARRNFPMPESNRRQAMLPLSAEPISNRWGTAPGVWVEKDGRIIVAMPGVPLELKGLMEEEVVPRLKRYLGNVSSVLVTRIIKTVGIGESALEEMIKDLILAQTSVTIAPYAKRWEVHLRLAVKAVSYDEGRERIAPLEAELRRRLGDYIYGYDQESLESVIGQLLTERGLTLGIAESCSGGLIGHRITEVPGSSAYFMVGVIAYSNQAKQDLLGVKGETLQEHGAVSAQIAIEMAEGVRSRYGVDLALSTTGIAGPGGGTDKKPVGLVHMALATPDGVLPRQSLFSWGRTENKIAAAQVGLAMIWQYLKKTVSS